MKKKKDNNNDNGRAREIPSLEEIELELMFKEGLDFTAEDFFCYYEALGWSFGRKPIRNWKALLRTWIRNKERFAGQKGLRLERAAAEQSRQTQAQQAAQAREQAQQEWERRYEESRQNRVSYEEYKRMKAAGMVP